MRVKDLRVLITGAASGAGRTIAEMLADADARVFVSDISDVSVADLSNARPDIRMVQADAGNEAEIDDMFRTKKPRPLLLSYLLPNDPFWRSVHVHGPFDPAWSTSHRRDCHDVFASLLTYLQHVRYPANLGPEIDVANTGIG